MLMSLLLFGGRGRRPTRGQQQRRQAWMCAYLAFWGAAHPASEPVAPRLFFVVWVPWVVVGALVCQANLPHANQQGVIPFVPVSGRLKLPSPHSSGRCRLGPAVAQAHRT